MIITAIARGGYAGISEHYTIDTEHNAQGTALQQALASAGFFSAASPPAAIGADLQHWTITVQAPGQQHSISFSDDGSPASLQWQGLLQQIRAAA